MFQSAPAIAGGRILFASFLTTKIKRFNPRPPLLAGESPRAARPGRATAVSIRARHCWRANPASSFVTSSWACFNPRPPLLAGESLPIAGPHGRLAVSIRARHCWRANHDGREYPGWADVVSIRARHCWRANRKQRATAYLLISRFQSAPAIAGGRIPPQA